MHWYYKKMRVAAVFGAVFVIVFLFGHEVFADAQTQGGGVLGTVLGSIGNIVRLALGFILSLYASAVGFVILQIAKYLIGIAQYTGFVDHPSVMMAWSLVRDVANMILVLVLLFIAMGTIFGSQAYSYKKLLPRLLVMAIAINFSRTIAGLMIDVGQVFMLTFVNAWAGAAGGNFVNALKIREILELNPANADVDQSQYIVGYFFAAALLTVTLIVLLAFALILTLRIVTLWMLIVLAPIAFALSAWPSAKAQRRYAEWWDQFVDNIVVGPAIAFFLWLTLATIGSGDVSSQSGFSGKFQETNEFINVGGAQVNPASISPTTAGTLEHFASYIIGIGMMIASLAMTQQMRVMGAQAGSKMLNWAQQKGKNLAYKYSGARYVAERYQAFQSLREQQRKERVSEFGAKAFGVYGTLQAGIGKGLRKLDVGDRWQQYAAKKREDAAGLRKSAAAARETGNMPLATSLDAQASALEATAKRWETAAKVAKPVQAAAAIGLSIPTGGLSGVALAPLLGPGMEKSGKQAQVQAESWKYRKVAQAMDALKNEDRDSVEKKSQGVGVTDVFERMAAIIRKVQEGWYASVEEVFAAGKTLQDLGADKKILSTFQASAERNYQTMPYRDAAGALEPAKLRKGVEEGTIDMRRLKVSELIADEGKVPVEVALRGTKSQWEDMVRTRGAKDAVRRGLGEYKNANLDIATGRGLTTIGDAYNDDLQKVAEHLAMTGAGAEAFAFNASGDFDPALVTSGDDVVHEKSFTQSMQGKNASKVLVSVKADQIMNPTTGATSRLGEAALNNINKISLRNAAKEAADSGDANQIAAMKAIVKALENAYTAGAAPAHINDLYDFAFVAKSSAAFDGFK